MKKTKYFLIAIMSLMVSTSCVDDNEFNNLVDSWEYPAKSTGPKGPSDPSSALSKDIPPLSDECVIKNIITFDKNLTGIEEEFCDTYDNSEAKSDPDYKASDFLWNIKNDQLTITSDQQGENDAKVISGVNTFVISGDLLTITNEEGFYIELSRVLE